MEYEENELHIDSQACRNGGFISKKYTGWGEDWSPDFSLRNISKDGKSMVIIMDDLDIPFIGRYNHWIIWNLPILSELKENIPFGESIESLGGAIQGMAYGKHVYRGPKPPVFIRNTHRYEFHFYILDQRLDLPVNSKKRELVKSMEGHILQHSVIMGKYKNQ